MNHRGPRNTGIALALVILLLSAAACGLSLAAAMLTKYNLILLVPCLLVFELAAAVESTSGKRHGAGSAGSRRALVAALLSRRTALVFLPAIGLWYAVHVALRIWLTGFHASSFTAVFRSLLAGFGAVSAVRTTPRKR